MSGGQVAIDLYPGAGLRLADARQVAVDCEQAGFAGLWTLEAGTEPFLPLALAAEHTSRLRLGTAVAVALVRNPMVVAHLAHELNRFAAGRLTLGLGTQVGAHVANRFGEPRVRSPAAAHFEVSCPVMVITGFDDESTDAARAAVRRQIAFYASTPAYREVLALYGLGDLADRLRTMSRAGRWEEMGELIDDDILAEFSVEAPPRAVVGEIRRRYDGVLDRALIYQPYPTPPGFWPAIPRPASRPRSSRP
jgi:alkanesulfonate monooxygenase SsuD/methylene tetrahydromethanopterin reductase-like flavin-dependent oxidoreductase (luciferase family)